ncbi:MAG: FCD domain-containing protein, partial [Pseudonocardiaceae bacterium]
LELRGNLQQSVEEHEAILAAIDARDAERAAELLAEHIEVPQRVLESDAGQALFREDPTFATDMSRRQS